MTAPAPTACSTCGGCRTASLRWLGGNRWTAEPCPDCCCAVCGVPTTTPPECDRCFIAEDAAAVRREDV